MGWDTLAGGAVYGVLGVFIMRGSRIALGIAAAMFAADSIYVLSAQLSTGNPPVGGAVVRFFVLMALARGFTRTQLTVRPGEPPAPPAAIAT
jgi:hypothetical protein